MAIRPIHTVAVEAKVLTHRGNSHQHWYQQGKQLTRQRKYDAALLSFDLALEMQPHDHHLWVFRGVVLTHLKHYDLALISFDRALAIASTDREAWIFRGAVLTYLDRHQEAHDSYSIALQIQRRGADVCLDYPLWCPCR